MDDISTVYQKYTQYERIYFQAYPLYKYTSILKNSQYTIQGGP